MGSRKNKKGQQETPSCIFCGSKPVTKEHFWPRWLKKIMPVTSANTHLSKDTYESGIMPLINYRPIRKQTKFTGPYHSKTIKKVCAACNNGWMSDIEYKAAPVLTSLIQDQTYVIDHESQSLICQWMFLKMICEDYLPNVQGGISETQRQSFYKTGAMPAYLKMWIARTDTFLEEPFWSRKIHIQKYTILSTGEIKQNTSRSTTYVIGNLLLHAGMFLDQEPRKIHPHAEYEIVVVVMGNMAPMLPVTTANIDFSKLHTLSPPEWIDVKDNLSYFTDMFFS